jgi:hypothetical protein
MRGHNLHPNAVCGRNTTRTYVSEPDTESPLPILLIIIAILAVVGCSPPTGGDVVDAGVDAEPVDDDVRRESCGQRTLEVDFSESLERDFSQPDGTLVRSGSLERCEWAWHAVLDTDTCLHPPKPNYTVPCPADGLRKCDTCGDEDCVSFDVQYLSEEPECVCLRQCSSDADCDGDGSCLCAQVTMLGSGGTSSRCFVGDCRSDNDCAEGERCMVPVSDRTWTHHCTKPVDECDPALTCDNNAAPVCRYDDNEQRYRCFPYPDPE